MLIIVYFKVNLFQHYSLFAFLRFVVRILSCLRMFNQWNIPVISEAICMWGIPFSGAKRLINFCFRLFSPLFTMGPQRFSGGSLDIYTVVQKCYPVIFWITQNTHVYWSTKQSTPFGITVYPVNVLSWWFWWSLFFVCHVIVSWSHTLSHTCCLHGAVYTCKVANIEVIKR